MAAVTRPHRAVNDGARRNGNSRRAHGREHRLATDAAFRSQAHRSFRDDNPRDRTAIACDYVATGDDASPHGNVVAKYQRPMTLDASREHRSRADANRASDHDVLVDPAVRGNVQITVHLPRPSWLHRLGVLLREG